MKKYRLKYIAYAKGEIVGKGIETEEGNSLANAIDRLQQRLEEGGQKDETFEVSKSQARCHWCENDAEVKDYRSVDGVTSKIPSCKECFELSTEFLLDRRYK